MKRFGDVVYHMHLSVRGVPACDVSTGVACIGVDNLDNPRDRRCRRVRPRSYMAAYQWVVHTTKTVGLTILSMRGRQERARPERRETVREACRVRRRRALVQRPGNGAEPTIRDRRVERLARGASLECRVRRVRRSVGNRERCEEKEGEETHGTDNEREGLEKRRGQWAIQRAQMEMADALLYKSRTVRLGDRRVSMRPYVNAPIFSSCLAANLVASVFCKIVAERYQARKRGRPSHGSNGTSSWRCVQEYVLITDTPRHLRPRFISRALSLLNATDGDRAFGSRTSRRGGVRGCRRIATMSSGEIGAHPITCWPSTISSSSARSSYMDFASFVFAKDRR
jgi:hypothetical protein